MCFLFKVVRLEKKGTLTRHTYRNTNYQALIISFVGVFLCGILLCASEMITNRFADWISGRIMSLQPDTDIQKLLSNGNRTRIRISEMLSLIFRGFRILEKVAHCTIIHLFTSEASFQPAVPRLRVCPWCNICIVV